MPRNAPRTTEAKTNITGAQRGNRYIGIHPDNLSIEIFVLEKSLFGCHSGRQKRNVNCGNRKPYSIGRFGEARLEKQGCQQDRKEFYRSLRYRPISLAI
jgi:hypothetical protein